MGDVFEATSRLVRSPAFKFCLISFLTLLLLVPLLMVQSLISERESRSRAVRQDVGRTWGPAQRLVGPFVMVPYTIRIETAQGDKRVEQTVERRALFTPESLNVVGNVEARTLRRSIFEVPVYATRLKLTGRFAAPRIADLAPDAVAVRWRDATLLLGLSGVSGLKEGAVLKTTGSPDVAFSPSLGFPSGSSTGIHARIAGASGQQGGADKELAPFGFEVDLAFNGSMALDFAPVARETLVSLASSWPHPSFEGAFLPEDRQITRTGFKASWKVPHLARSVPEAWSTAEAGIERLSPFTFGVRMVAPVDFFSLVNRATKYGVMFLTLVYMAVFCLELATGISVHPVQYMFTGIALVFFYVLLLSLAEHIGFATAYVVAAAATAAMLATYIGAVSRNLRTGGLMLVVLAVTYLLLYFILQLEDYALLAGALLGFTALTTIMFATLRVDWMGAAGRQPRELVSP